MKQTIISILILLLAGSCATKTPLVKNQEKYEPEIVFSTSHELDTLIACNGLEKKEVIPENVEGEVVINWTKDDDECIAECRYWRVVKFRPNGNICVQIIYNTGKFDI